MNSDELIGIHEISKIAKVTPAAVSNWRARDKSFPPPVKELQSGPIFERSQIISWLKIKEKKMAKVIAFFNNKGGVGKTTSIWNLSISLAEHGKSVLLIDFDPQCNLSIAALGDNEFANQLESSREFPYGKTIRSYALPYIEQNNKGDVFILKPKFPPSNGNLDIVPGDFWLNKFSDVLNVGTDVIGGAGLYRFLLPSSLINAVEEKYNKRYDFVLIDLPPSFNTLVRSALYSSDYFLVPCTPDLFSAYCVGLIGTVLPNFIEDWEQGKKRYLQFNSYDQIIPQKGQPKFGGWIFNGFDTRKKANQDEILKTGADRAQYDKILNAVDNNLLPRLKNSIEAYHAVPGFVDQHPVASIEDLNVMAPDSIVQNVPIKYLSKKRPTRDLGRGTWSQEQKDLMNRMDKEYDTLAEWIANNY
jgi:cellulose biosynthesis protein BcsQ